MLLKLFQSRGKVVAQKGLVCEEPVGGIIRRNWSKEMILYDVRDKTKIMKWAAFVSLVCEVYLLVHENKLENIRGMYYRLKNLFDTPTECYNMINLLGNILGCTRGSLNLKTSSRGCLVGQVEYLNRAANKFQWQQATECGANGIVIPPEVFDSTAFAVKHCALNKAKFILVVEKDTIFNQLLQSKFYMHNPCVIVTGKGFPCLATRAFIKRVQLALDLDVVGLCDWNPFGFSLMMSYMYGSESMPESYLYAVPNMKVIGLLKQDVQNENHRFDSFFQKYSDMDTSKALALMNSKLLKKNDMLLQEIKYSFERKLKLELDYMNEISLGDDYLTNQWISNALLRRFL